MSGVSDLGVPWSGRVRQRGGDGGWGERVWGIESVARCGG